jgi:hypothetical protein
MGPSTAHRRALPITGYPKENGCRRAGRLQSSSDRPRWCSDYVADQRTEPTCKPRCCLGRAGGALELELQLGPPLLVGLLGQAKIGLSGADLLDGALERVETQGIDAALIQPYSGHAQPGVPRGDLQPTRPHRRPAQLRQRHRPLPRLKDPPSWRPATRSGVPGRRGRSLGVAVGQVLDEVQHQGQPGTHAPAPIPVSTVTATSRATPLRTARRTRPAGSTAGDVDAARPRSC